MWEVVGGGEKGGIVARQGQELKSAEQPSRLGTGALIRELKLVGERLQFQLVEGSGPETGWVSLSFKGSELVRRTERVPATVSRPRPEPGSVKPAFPPQCEQTPGQPFHFYHQINFYESKPTGLRMSGCFGAMDECRVDSHACCDQSVETMRGVEDPMIEISMELAPAILQLGKEASTDGLLYAHPDSRGAVKSWLRVELEFGFPSFPFKTEEQTIYLVGKVAESPQRTRVARANFLKAFVDSDTGGLCAEDPWSGDIDMFYADLKSRHSQDRLAVYPLRKLYEPEGKPFTPTLCKKVSWLMSYSYTDLWGLHYHGKTPEVLWDLNMAAGGAFAELVRSEPDPQALAAGLHKKMDFGLVFDALCFLEEGRGRAAYVVLAQGKDSPSDVVLSVCARYAWAGVPEDGRTLCGEDFDVMSRGGFTSLIKFALGGGEGKAGKVCDLTKLPRP